MTATAHVGARRQTLPLRWRLDALARNGLRAGIKMAFALAVVVAIAPVVLVARGFQPSVLRSTAMQPSISAGDVVFYENVSPAAVQVGDVITFTDPARPGQATTARVLEVGHIESTYAFTTKADAAAVVSKWTITQQEPINRVAFRVPAVGRALDLPAAIATRGPLVLLVLGVLLALARGSAMVRARRANARYW